MSNRPLILVTGATGNQGGATADRLLDGGKVQVRALSRDPSGEKAQKLVARGVEVVPGDLDDRTSLDRALAGVSGVFSVQNFFDGGVENEVRRGVAMADAAKAAGVAHFVYTSVDGAERSTGIPHFDSKYRIEQHIGEIGLPATILRPTLFMDMLANAGMMRSMLVGMLRAVLGRTQPIQMVATTDIGWFAARALESPETAIGRRIALAGDDPTVPSLVDIVGRVTGRGVWMAPIPGFAISMLPAEMRLMLRWFGEHGYAADIPALRREHAGLLGFEQFLRSNRVTAGH